MPGPGTSRTIVFSCAGPEGLHPLDLALGLSADAFSLLVTEIRARLRTLVSYEQVTALSLYFLGWSPLCSRESEASPGRDVPR